MSLQTWMQEYYPIPANDKSLRDNHHAQIAHSLRKWEGLLPDALNKHDVTILRNFIRDKHSKFYIDSDSCSLCKFNLDQERPWCLNCPLFNYLGERCDKDMHSPYQIWLLHNFPQPMIDALRATLAKYE